MTIKHDLSIRTIDKKLARQIIYNFHYLGKKGFRSGINYGLFNKQGHLIGCAIFTGVSAPETMVGAFGRDRDNQDGILELSRLVLHPDYNGKNYGSFFLGYCLRDLKKKGYEAVISYASSDLHTGAIYQSSNWKYYGTSNDKKDFYRDVDGKLVKQERGKTKDVKGVWVQRPIKHRYIFPLKKRINILWKQEEYPKGNNNDNTCYGCNGVGKVTNQKMGLEYDCPICN